MTGTLSVARCLISLPFRHKLMVSVSLPWLLLVLLGSTTTATSSYSNSIHDIIPHNQRSIPSHNSCFILSTPHTAICSALSRYLLLQCIVYLIHPTAVLFLFDLSGQEIDTYHLYHDPHPWKHLFQIHLWLQLEQTSFISFSMLFCFR